MRDGDKFNVLGFTGSLRRQSINRGLLRAAQAADRDIAVDIFDIGSVPLFNQDIELPVPAPVADFKRRIAEADAVLIATPEYNQSIPGTLKNALDWASRPNKNHVFTGKPVSILGASSGKSGTMRAQLLLRAALHALGCHVLPRPEIFLPFAAKYFDDDGRLIDKRVTDEVHDLVRALKQWTLLLQQQTPAKATLRSPALLSDAEAQRS